MHLEHLRLVDFRSYADADVPLGPGTTVLLGDNGQGKTNLLEAVGYLAVLSSHRVSGDAALVRQGCERAVIGARVRRGDRVATTDVEITPGSGVKVQVNRSPVARSRRAPSLLRAVVFAPEDLAIVKGEPDRRRRFLDDLVVARAPRIAGVISDYERVIRQRTALLKTLRGAGAPAKQAASASLDVWDARLAEFGAELLHARLSALTALRPHAERAYDEVSGATGPLRLRYAAKGLRGVPLVGTGDGAAGDGEGERRGGDGRETPSDEVPTAPQAAEALATALQRSRGDEIERCVCLVGPHRDDVDLALRGLPVRGYASHGESWSAALALRLGGFDLLDDPDDPTLQPVLVLDDVFAELDARRRSHLADRASRAEQALVSAAALEDVPDALRGQVIRVARDAAGVSVLTP